MHAEFGPGVACTEGGVRGHREKITTSFSNDVLLLEVGLAPYSTLSITMRAGRVRHKCKDDLLVKTFLLEEINEASFSPPSGPIHPSSY